MATDLRQVGAYELQQRLGRSNRSELWKAYDPQGQRNVAIKLILAQSRGDPDYPVHFRGKVAAIASLHHPNIAQIYDARLLSTNDASTTLAYLVMEYVEGQTLANYMHNLSHSGKVPPGPEIVQIFAFIGIAIDYAHQHGIVHGELKPSNVILRRSPGPSSKAIEPVLTDIALTKLLNNTTNTSAKRNLDALLYISPEQARGYPESKYSDIYSMGVMLYEICTGVLPFQGNRPVALLMQHANANPPSPALINPNTHPASDDAACCASEQYSLCKENVRCSRAERAFTDERYSVLFCLREGETQAKNCIYSALCAAGPDDRRFGSRYPLLPAGKCRINGGCWTRVLRQ